MLVKILTVNQLKKIMQDLLIAAGVPKGDASLISDVLALANLRCVDSHGLSRCLDYLRGIKYGDINPKPNVKLVLEGDFYC